MLYIWSERLNLKKTTQNITIIKIIWHKNIKLWLNVRTCDWNCDWNVSFGRKNGLHSFSAHSTETKQSMKHTAQKWFSDWENKLSTLIPDVKSVLLLQCLSFLPKITAKICLNVSHFDHFFVVFSFFFWVQSEFCFDKGKLFQRVMTIFSVTLAAILTFHFYFSHQMSSRTARLAEHYRVRRSRIPKIADIWSVWVVWLDIWCQKQKWNIKTSHCGQNNYHCNWPFAKKKISTWTDG